MAQGPDGAGFKPGHRASPSLYASDDTIGAAATEADVTIADTVHEDEQEPKES